MAYWLWHIVMAASTVIWARAIDTPRGNVYVYSYGILVMDMCIGMCTEMRMDMCMDMCMDICMDMCT